MILHLRQRWVLLVFQQFHFSASLLEDIAWVLAALPSPVQPVTARKQAVPDSSQDFGTISKGTSFSFCRCGLLPSVFHSLLAQHSNPISPAETLCAGTPGERMILTE